MWDYPEALVLFAAGTRDTMQRRVVMSGDE